MSSGFFGQVAGAKERGPGYEYLGSGKYVLEVLELKERDSKFIAELKVIEASPHQGQPAENRVGDDVSWLVNCGGSQMQIEMGRADVKGFMLALIRSAGRDPETIPASAWEGIGDKACGRQNAARGLRVHAQAWRGANKTTGEIRKIPSVRWSAIPGQSRPELFEVFGAPTTKPTPAAGAAAPAGDLLAKLEQAFTAAKAKGVDAAKVMDSDSPGYKRAIAAGVTPAQYLAVVEKVFGTEGDGFDFA